MTRLTLSGKVYIGDARLKLENVDLVGVAIMQEYQRRRNVEYMDIEVDENHQGNKVP